MPRDFTPKVITANHLLEGDVVYLTADDRWTRYHEEAELITDAKDGPKGPEPTHFREVFRTRGPSNYAHGKQVEL